MPAWRAQNERRAEAHPIEGLGGIRPMMGLRRLPPWFCGGSKWGLSGKS